jgi:hypothetical protein
VCSPAVLRVLLCRAPGYRQHHHQLEVHTGESDGSGTGHDVVVEVVVEGGGVQFDSSGVSSSGFSGKGRHEALQAASPAPGPVCTVQ